MSAAASVLAPTATPLLLRDGSAVTARPFGADERDVVQRVFDAMSAESRRLRFLTAVPRLTERSLRLLTDVDHIRHGAWAAETVDGPVAVGRWIRLSAEPHVAEVALSVADAYQGRGLGRGLLSVLGVAAEQVGISGFAWTMDVENRRALRLAAANGGSRRASLGVVEARTGLPPADGIDAEAVRRLLRRVGPQAVGLAA
jgi:GNAT superfamily N-acetyltransferase